MRNFSSSFEPCLSWHRILVRSHPFARMARAFTLVEIMLAMAVSAMLLVILLKVLNQVTHAWQLETRRESTLRESRNGLRLLADDLQALHPLPPETDPQIDELRQRFVLQGASEMYNSSSFAFLRITRVHRTASLLPENSDLRLVAYAVGLSKDSGGGVSQKLWRKELDSAETLRRVQAHMKDQTPLISDADWASFVGEDGYVKTADGDFGRDAEPLVYDLIKFSVFPLQPTNGSGNGDVYILSQSSTSQWPAHLIPTHLDLRLRVTNRTIGAQLETLADWTGRGKFNDKLSGTTMVTTGSTTLSLPPTGSEVRVQTLRIRLMQSNIDVE